jgi:hypothetical protein
MLRCSGIEEMRQQRVMEKKDITNIAKWRLFLQIAVFEASWFVFIRLLAPSSPLHVLPLSLPPHFVFRMQHLLMFVTLLNIVVLCFYGIYGNIGNALSFSFVLLVGLSFPPPLFFSVALDTLAGIFIIFYFVEVVLKVVAYGFKEYWNYARFRQVRLPLFSFDSF